MNPPSNNPPTTTANVEDSRVIAYLGNWQDCPTNDQVKAYTHIVIAFAISYTWAASQNQCDAQCNVATPVSICNNANNQALIDEWRGMGKKVILSFGGAGMGGSWSGDNNNCWDYCFGKEEQLSTSLVNIVDEQNFDGIDVDYEYCLDTAGSQNGRCSQRTNLYSDYKAQTFLDGLTSKLRVKLDALQVSNGYNRGRYEVTHAPMDSDLSSKDSKYFQILKRRSADLDFLMPQFYNGVTRPGIDGIGGANAGSMSAISIFDNLVNDMFSGRAEKVVFGFCISDCSSTGSNVSGSEAAQVMGDLRAYNQGAYECNGGAFFWVAQHDVGGLWSNAVDGAVSVTRGCSGAPTSVAPISSQPTSSAPVTNAPSTVSPISASPSTKTPSKAPSTSSPVSVSPVSSQPISNNPTSTSPVSNAPSSASPISASPSSKAPVSLQPTSTAPVSTQPTSNAPVSSQPISGTGPTTPKPTQLVVSTSPRCGISEIDARERCQKECVSSADCPSGQWCWGTHANYCGSIKQRIYYNPVQSSQWTRCGTNEIFARTFCTQECSWQGQCPDGQDCLSLNPNYCGSEYYEV
jgi:chitinase